MRRVAAPDKVVLEWSESVMWISRGEFSQKRKQQGPNLRDKLLGYCN